MLEAGRISVIAFPSVPVADSQLQLADLPWPQIMGVVTVIVSILMVSHVPYPVIPRLGFKATRNTIGTIWVVGGLALALIVPRYYFFPATILYTAWGLLHSVILGLWDRLPERDPLLDLEEDDAGEEVRELDYGDLAPGRFRKKRRPRRKKKTPGGSEGDEPAPGTEDPA